ncbi:hypothetical protein F4814DRAFT_432854 [Daldinia grandis]|nr:hypothetical protein F4814DRAFT_432854 [Daldinia grandis]
MDQGIERPPASQTSSHFPLLEPISGATLYELESARRETLRRRGRIRTGCVEVDDAVLLGGLERGSVVGVSAEDIEFGLLVGLQTVAHTMVFEGESRQRAAIVTTLTPAAILPALRDVIRAQVQVALGPTANQKQEVVNAEVRRCLERISISRVFDVEGLWEVLSELETPPLLGCETASKEKEKEKEEEVASTTATTEDKGGSVHVKPPGSFSPDMSNEEGKDKDERVEGIPPSPPHKTKRMEVADSEDEEELSLSPPSLPEQQPPAHPPPSSPPKPPSSPSPPPAVPTAQATTTPNPVLASNQEHHSHIPDLILITHFSTLLTNLFTRSADNKAAAHTTLQLLSSHLRYLARSGDGPLVVLLNSTTVTSVSTSGSAGSAGTSRIPPNLTSTTAAAAAAAGAAVKDRPLEPTLRSIFLPAPLPGIGVGGGSTATSRRQSKPAFGASFAQFLDLHLLCTRVPRTRADAEALVAGTSGLVWWCWVVEVLLDELGAEVYRDGDKGGSRHLADGSGDNGRVWRSREQRWGAVDVRGRVRVVDAILGG